MNHAKRIDKLEAELSPDQIWRRWLDAALRFNSRADHAMWVAQDMQNRQAFPTFVRDLMPYATSKSNEKPAERRNRLSQAQQTLHWNYYLFEEVNKAIERQLEHLSSLACPLLSEIDRLEGNLLQPLAWMPLPLPKEDAATARAALDNYIMPQRDFCDEFSRWICEYCAETAVNETALGPEQRLAIWKEVRSTHEIGSIKWEYYVELKPFPYRSLGAAALVDGRWIDLALLKMAEFAALLASSGFRLEELPDSHPLEPLMVMNKSGLYAREQELLPIRKKAESRLRQFKGTIRMIRRRAFVDIDEYRSWPGRAVAGELSRMWGVNVAHWNQRFDSLGGEGRAQVGGVKIHRLRDPFSSRDFAVCDHEMELELRRQARRLVLQRIHGTRKADSAATASRSLVREIVSAALIAAHASAKLVKRMERIFDGHPVIFRKTEEQLAHQLTFCEEIANRYNETCLTSVQNGDSDESDSAWSQIVFGSAEVNAEKRSEVVFNTIRDRAKAYALESLGCTEAARKLFCELIANHLPASKDRAKTPTESKTPEPPGPSLFERMLAYADKLDRLMKAKEGRKSETKSGTT